MKTYLRETALALTLMMFLGVVPAFSIEGVSKPILSAGSVQYLPTSGSNLTLGINYLSAGNEWADTATTLDDDFSRFSMDGIKHISVRMMWSVMEPNFSSPVQLSSSMVSNVEKVLTEASKYGIQVNLDFWTQFGYTLGLPKWVSTTSTPGYWSIVRDASILTDYIDYIKTVVTALMNFPAVESWTIFNEPYFNQGSDEQAFETAFPMIVQAIKSVDSGHIVTCRFTLSCTPGSGSYDSTVYSVFDVFSITEYLDPSDPNSVVYNANWSHFDNTVSYCQSHNIRLWVIEFGSEVASGFSSSQADIATRCQSSLRKFAATGVIERAYAWAWQHNDASAEAFNIFDGTNPYSSYDELASFAAGS